MLRLASRVRRVGFQTHGLRPLVVPLSEPVAASRRGFAAKKKSKSTEAPAGGNDGRAGALSAALRSIESQFGKGAVVQLGGQAKVEPAAVISTGSLTLDRAVGIGGLPKGRIIEVYGPESSGKTTLTLHTIAEAQKQGLTCVFIDVEHALDPLYAKAIGVSLEKLYLCQPGSGEEALEIADTFVRSGAIDVVVVDSVAALVPRQEIDGEMGDAHIALQARMMSSGLRKLLSSLHVSRSCMIIFLNQLRSKVGVMFGSPDVTSGGNALKFYASLRLEIRRIAQIKQGDQVVGNRTRVKVVKNKMAPPYVEAEFDMTFGHGISKLGELVDLGEELGIIEKSGAWYSLTETGEKIGQGREKVKAYFEENPEQAALVEKQIREKMARAPLEPSFEADAVVAEEASEEEEFPPVRTP